MWSVFSQIMYSVYFDKYVGSGFEHNHLTNEWHFEDLAEERLVTAVFVRYL